MAKKNSIQRLRQIVMTLGKYGFGYVIDNKLKSGKESPENLRKAFEELGPTFIKLGQILSTRSDIIPYDYIVELQKLQDNTIPIKYETVEGLFYKELNRSIDDVFMYFEVSPLACASIAQVHRAIMNDGRAVIVKIQRPEIKECMELDISIIKKLINITNTKFHDAPINPKEALDEILTATKMELDFQNEASSIEKFRVLNKNVKFTNAPFVVKSLCSKRILTMEYISGIKITNKISLKRNGYDLNDIGKKLALSYFKQVFEDGFFHGDPHPGNIIIKNSQIYFIDFGIIGSLSKYNINILNEIVISVALKDIDRLVSGLLSIGIRRGYVDRNKLYESIDYLFDNYMHSPLQNIQISKLFEDTFNAAAENNLSLPKELTLLIKGFVIIEGVIAEISPEVKILDIAISYIKSHHKLKMLPDMDEFLLSIYALGRDSKQIPSKILKLINNAISGRLKIQFEVKNIYEPIEQLHKMVNRVVFALITSSLIIGSSFIVNTNIGPKIHGISLLGVTGFLAAAFFGLWLLISILKSGKL